MADAHRVVVGQQEGGAGQLDRGLQPLVPGQHRAGTAEVGAEQLLVALAGQPGRGEPADQPRHLGGEGREHAVAGQHAVREDPRAGSHQPGQAAAVEQVADGPRTAALEPLPRQRIDQLGAQLVQELDDQLQRSGDSAPLPLVAGVQALGGVAGEGLPRGDGALGGRRAGLHDRGHRFPSLRRAEPRRVGGKVAAERPAGPPRTGSAVPLRGISRTRDAAPRASLTQSGAGRRLFASRAASSAGRAPALHAGGHWFEPGAAHHLSRSGARGRGAVG